jgi:phosphoglycolate phosphatase
MMAAKGLVFVICRAAWHGSLAISRGRPQSASMSPFPFDVVAFDLDGTLADTSPDIAAALNLMLGDLGRPALEPGHIRSLIGDGAKSLIRKALAATGETSEALVEKGYPIYVRRYGDDICGGTMRFPFVEDALDGLAERGVTLALCTNKPEGLTLALLGSLGWADRFPVLIGGDTLPWRKPDPRPLLETRARAGGGRMAFIGDSMIDAETARAAGVPFVAVSFGFSDRPAGEFGADAVIDDFGALIGALEAL